MMQSVSDRSPIRFRASTTGARKRAMSTGLVLGLLVLALGACGRKEMPPLSAIANAPVFRPGSTWTYRVEDSSQDKPIMVTLTYEKEEFYKGGAVLVFRSGDKLFLYDRDLNFVAEMSNGRVLREATPSHRSFDFPFYVGKEWRAVFTFQDHERTLSWVPVEVFWKAKEYDQIKVPAGQFRAFRLISDPSTNWGLEEEVWYAPEVKLPVRWKHKRSSAHYLGKGKQSGELLRYTIK